MEIILLVIIVVIGVLFFIGKPSFWKAIQKNRQQAMEFFLADDVWYVDQKPDGIKVVGPFFFEDNYGTLHKIYGQRDKIEASQDAFLERLTDKVEFGTVEVDISGKKQSFDVSVYIPDVTEATTNDDLVTQLIEKSPNAHNALTHLIPFIDKNHITLMVSKGHRGTAQKSVHKNFSDLVKLLLGSMKSDCIISRQTDRKNIPQLMLNYITEFSKAYPNWQDAYNFSDQYFMGLKALINKTKSPEDIAQINFSAMKVLAEKGIAEAEYELGWKYINGDGISKDHAGGVIWVKKAASQGVAQYQYMVAMLYTDGRIQIDDQKALKWFHKAADQGHVKSQQKLGSMYSLTANSDCGVAVNGDEAFKWYSLAAHNEDERSQFNLAEIYKFGRGIPANNEEAFKWYLRSAKQEYVMAMYELATMYEYGDGVDRNFSLAFHWYSKAAKRNHSKAKPKVAFMTERDVGYVKENLLGKGLCAAIETEKDEGWYREAAAQGYVEAMFILGVFFAKPDVNEKGLYCKKQAFFYFREAAYRGHVKSQIATAELYSQGYGGQVWDGIDEDVNNKFDFNDGLEFDQVQGLKWLIIAKKSNPHVNTELVRAEMRPEAILIAQTLADEWKKTEGEMDIADEPSPFSKY